MFNDSTCSDCTVVCSTATSVTEANCCTSSSNSSCWGWAGASAEAGLRSSSSSSAKFSLGSFCTEHSNAAWDAVDAAKTGKNDQPGREGGGFAGTGAVSRKQLHSDALQGEGEDSPSCSKLGVVVEQQFHCHRVVLVSQSPVLRAMLLSPMQEGQQGCIQLAGVEPQVAEAFLRCLYGCKVAVLAEQLIPLAALADQYHVPWLYDAAVAAVLKSARGCSAEQLVGLYLEVAGRVGGDLRLLLLQLLLGRVEEVVGLGLFVHLGCEDLMEAARLLLQQQQQGSEAPGCGDLMGDRLQHLEQGEQQQWQPQEQLQRLVQEVRVVGAATAAAVAAPAASLLERAGAHISWGGGQTAVVAPAAEGGPAMAALGGAQQGIHGGGASSSGVCVQQPDPVHVGSVLEVGHVLAACWKGCWKGVGAATAAPARVQRALFDLYVSWAAHHPVERLGHLRLLLDSLKLKAMSMADLAVVQSHPLVLRALALGEESTSWARQACGDFQQQLTEVLEAVHGGQQQRKVVLLKAGVDEGGQRHGVSGFLEAGGIYRVEGEVEGGGAAGHLHRVIQVGQEAGGAGGVEGRDVPGLVGQLGHGLVFRGIREMLMDPAPAAMI